MANLFRCGGGDKSKILHISAGGDMPYLSGLNIHLYLENKRKVYYQAYRGGSSTTSSVYGYTDSTFNYSTRVLLKSNTGFHDGNVIYSADLNGYKYIRIEHPGYRENVYFNNIWWE